MRILTKIILLVFYVLTPFAVAKAQNAPTARQPKLPPGILVKTPPDFASWKVTFQNAAGKSQVATDVTTATNTRLVESIEYVKTQNIGVSVTTYSDHTKATSYCVGNTQLAIYPEHKDSVYVNDLHWVKGWGEDDIFMNHYPNFDWISRSNYIGVKEFNQIQCFVFKRSAPNVENAATSLTKLTQPGTQTNMIEPAATTPEQGSALAYVSVDGLWPVAYVDNTGIRKFVHQPPPTQILILPPNFQRALDGYTKVQF